MSRSAHLLEPYLDPGAIRSTRFIDGQVLSRKDLERERAAVRRALERLGRAIGHGVAWGLQVQAPSSGGTNRVQRLVNVTPGVAVNANGQMLSLEEPVDVMLDHPSAAAAGSASGERSGKQETPDFAPCEAVSDDRDRVYVFSMAAAEPPPGARLPSRARSATQVVAERVEFRLHEVPLQPDELDGRLRNRAAYKFFRTSGARAPSSPAPIDDEVRLALVHFQQGSVRLVDPWPVRRHLTATKLLDEDELGSLPVEARELLGSLGTLDEGIRAAEGAAMVMQFQEEIARLAAPLSATQRFAYLPPIGFLPREIGAGTFLAGLASRNTSIDAECVPALLREALAYPPVELAHHVPVTVYSVEEPFWREGGAQTRGHIFVNGLVPVRGRLESALARGPVSAQDFEALAIWSGRGKIARALAVARTEIWKEGPVGTVEVLLVPALPPEARTPDRQGPVDGGVNAASVNDYQDETIRKQVEEELNRRGPVGTRCLVKWARMKEVTVRAKLRVTSAKGPVDAVRRAAEVRRRALDGLHQLLNPLPCGERQGWPFDRPLEPPSIESVLLEPGVEAEAIELEAEGTPAGGQAVAADVLQPDAWYVADGERLHRSRRNGEGWEIVWPMEGRAITPGANIARVKPHPKQPGLLAIAAQIGDASRLHLSRDHGETWPYETEVPALVYDMSWMPWTDRNGVPTLLAATTNGLYEIESGDRSQPRLVRVDPGEPSRACWAVAAADDVRCAGLVAVSTGTHGIFLSKGNARDGSFTRLAWPQRSQDGERQDDDDVRVLKWQLDGSRAFLWAGIRVPGNEPGRGCRVWERDSGQWVLLDQGWARAAGSCRDIAFDGRRVYAATKRGGVYWREGTNPKDPWNPPERKCGLLEREGRDQLPGTFEPVESVAVHGSWLLAVSPHGPGARGAVLRAPLRASSGASGAVQYEDCLSKENVVLPPGWLICSGRHVIEVAPQ